MKKKLLCRLFALQFTLLTLSSQEMEQPPSNPVQSERAQNVSEEPEDEYDIPEENTIHPEPQRKHLTLKGEDHDLTKKQRDKFLTAHGKTLLALSLEQGAPYLPYIRQKLIELNMPLELQYLPIVESNFKITAVSKTGATGMWQFMENSMAPFLKKNSWYDERLDPWLSTDAALTKLCDNYKMFGDWEIAIAAYNCGAGAMSRAKKKNPGKDFWALATSGALRTQTAEYVPKLLAVCDIILNAEYYGALEVGVAYHLTEEKKTDYSYVTTKGMYSLSEIAEEAGISKKVLEELNPSLKRRCTPAGELYKLRVPKDMTLQVEECLKHLGPPKNAIVHKVVKGDSLWALSRTYGISVQDLCKVNNIKENGILSIGQTIIIPIF